jgi:hypothetical protein
MPATHPQPIAISRIIVLSKVIRDKNSGNAYKSSEVISRINAVTVSHKLTSSIERGKFMQLTYR